ncbi:hypothetical protein [Kribbella sp. NPDC051620]|uniref:hypothetical protein n=1 Tax=Kribbella sp. NPDC051620 TaxID=3364120 RepID=UPI0037A1F75B
MAKKIAKDPAGYTSLICLLLGIVMAGVPVPKSLAEPIDAVAYSIVAAALFSILYQFWANGALVSLISETVERSGIESAKQVAELHSAHWPLEIFPPGSAPNPIFNKHIDTALASAVRYDFRGQSGKHLANRLNQTPPNRLRYVRIIIEDSTIEDVMRVRVEEKRHTDPARYKNSTDEALEKIVRGDMRDSLIGLFLARTHYEEICIVYAPRPTDIRVEIVSGQSVFVSPYLRNRPDGFRYPEVLRYDHQSMPAQLWVLEFDREFSILGRTGVLKLTPATGAQVLHKHLRSKGWLDSIEELRGRIDDARQNLS